ncbi:ATP phosphoribosyltransferase regulatory subunit [Candidatus Daviesbacteria bacterium]|nr:ATP phosphoribosyltransferase regulatory subunit [Candidatus Daviesbacteria bacterium]
MLKAPPTPKGFRDIPPPLAKKRREVINKIASCLEGAGFVPIDTPTIEFAEVLLGKYGEEADRLIYQFKDRGGRKLGLRYDLTVPLARYVATYNPPLPFRRYQIGQVFRGENPQKGRWREFTQFDIDTVGSSDLVEDAKIIAAVIKAVKVVGLDKPVMMINDRKNFEGLDKDVITTIDKLDKIGDKGVTQELVAKGVSEKEAVNTLKEIKNKKPTPDLEEIFKYLKQLGVREDEYQFVPTLARGLDYYTGTIFELKVGTYGLSVGGGGRYDNLIGMFVYPDKGGVKKQIPAVGFGLGLDRLLEILNL